MRWEHHMRAQLDRLGQLQEASSLESRLGSSLERGLLQYMEQLYTDGVHPNHILCLRARLLRLSLVHSSQPATATRAAVKLGVVDEALGVAERVLKLGGGYDAQLGDLLFQKGFCLQMCGQPREAAGCFMRARQQFEFTQGDGCSSGKAAHELTRLCLRQLTAVKHKSGS